MSKLKCLKCGADLPALDRSPCPKCGTIADKGRVTEEFQTLRKVTAKAGYAAATERRVGALLEFYRENPKFLGLHIALIIVTIILREVLSIFLGPYLGHYIPSPWNNVLFDVAEVIISILVVIFVRPPKEKGVIWPE